VQAAATAANQLPKLLTVLSRSLHDIPPVIVEDALEEAFTKWLIAHQAGKSVSVEGSAGWIYTAAKRLALRERVRQKRFDSLDINDSKESDTMVEITSRIDVGLLLVGLTAKQREVIILTKLLGYDIQQASELMGMSCEAANKNVTRAIQRIRGTLSAEIQTYRDG
jgi:RNA polymerase sigma factor (sigma-70 family)